MKAINRLVQKAVGSSPDEGPDTLWFLVLIGVIIIFSLALGEVLK